MSILLSNVNNLCNIIRYSNDVDDMLVSVHGIRVLLSVQNQPPFEPVFNTGIIPNLLRIMERKLPNKDTLNDEKVKKKVKKMGRLQFETAWAITNVASGDPKYTNHLVRVNGINSFISLLKNTSDVETSDQCIWGLGNIAGDCPRLRDEVLMKTDLLDFVLKNIKEFPLSMKRNAVWTLSNFCRGKPSPDWNTIKPVIKPLTKLLSETKDYDIIVDILWAISFLSEDRQSNDKEQIRKEEEEFGLSFQIDAVLESGAIKSVIHLIKHCITMGNNALNAIQQHVMNNLIPPPHLQQQLSTSDFVIAPCVRILGNIVAGTDTQTQGVVDAGFYDIIGLCLNHRIRNIVKESCWALSNVVAGTQNQLDLFINNTSLITKIVSLTLNGDINIRKEAGWCLSNSICGAKFDQVLKLVEHNFINAMISLLTINSDRIILMVCESLDNCMSSWNKFEKNNNDINDKYNPFVEKVKNLEGVTRLQAIENNNNSSDNVREAVHDLLKKFWPHLYPDEIIEEEQKEEKEQINENNQNNENEMNNNENNNISLDDNKDDNINDNNNISDNDENESVSSYTTTDTEDSDSENNDENNNNNNNSIESEEFKESDLNDVNNISLAPETEESKEQIISPVNNINSLMNNTMSRRSISLTKPTENNGVSFKDELARVSYKKRRNSLSLSFSTTNIVDFKDVNIEEEDNDT